MKLVTYINSKGNYIPGINISGHIFNLIAASQIIGKSIPDTILGIIESGDEAMETVREIEQKIISLGINPDTDLVKLISPIPNPPSCRDAYAFRQHVESARRNRGVEMIPEFDEYPIFYFTNHNAIFGEGDIWVEKDHLEKLDFELEWAAVIGKTGKNVPSGEADNYIAGFTIMNDLSARLLQMEEMKLNLGPAKGKDFATTLGPFLITPDELEEYKTSTPFGNQYNLKMEAYHNGELISSGNTADMTWTFAEIIERVSYGVAIRPGEVIGSGTVGTGCYLELNGTRTRIAKESGENYTPVWLQPNDEISLKIDMLGTLNNRIVYSNSDYSILSKKKINK
ncbi:MAG: fumarylacetoacetate hydrolase family protein [Candidatus Kapabacteria bacterium]|nr:fumarylacetoacetate hydrolase family protein [Candidatus Kapabacteria bacterium]